MIEHASIYESKEQLEHNGLRVLVMRQWPRGVRKERIDLWLKEAGPSRQLLQAYNRGELTWDQFEERYRAEMAERPEVLEQLRALEREHGTLTLLCHERIPPRDHCHRVLLAGLLEDSLKDSSA